MKQKVKIVISYGAPALIVLFLMSVILLIQGIWPFGSETIDFYDMGQQVANEYTQIYDEIHGTRSVVFDWYTCLSRGIPGGTYLSLLNLLYYFVPRNMILETFSIMLVIKMMCMAVAMRILLKNEVSGCPEFFSIVLSAGYGMCGYALMNYTIIAWLDIAMLVPLVLMFAQRLLRDGKMTGYIICTALTLCISFYVPVMVLLFTFIMTGIYLISKKLKAGGTFAGDHEPERGPYVLRLGIGAVSAIVLSAWAWIPKVFLAAGSQRFDNEAESGLIAQYLKILTHVQPDYATRLWCLLGVSFAAAISVTGLIRDLRKKNYRRLIFAAGGFFILLMQLVFENVQLFWHFGSYVNYPVRDGFLMYLVFALAAAVYAADLKETTSDFGLPVSFPMGGIVVSVLITAVLVFWYRSNEGTSVYTVFKASVLFAAGCFFIYLFLLLFRSGKYLKMSVFLICAELIFYGVVLIGKPLYITGYSEDAEQEGEYIRIAYDLKEKLDIPSSRLNRIKNPDTSLNTNYGSMLERSTLTGWPSSLSGDVISSAYIMGNSIQYTRILDSGGNAFSDALLHTTQVLSLDEQDERLYDKISSAYEVIDEDTGDERIYSLYNCRYVLPFGTIVNNENSLDEISVASDPVQFANAAYRAIGNDDSDIAQKVETGEAGQDFSVDVSSKKLLYITAECGDCETSNYRIYVNGKAIRVPTLKYPDNESYPAHFNNNCIYLGSFCDETVTVSIQKDENVSDADYDFTMYALDLDKLGKLCAYYEGQNDSMSFAAGNRTIDAEVTGKASQYLMLPMEYSSDWSVEVNGQKTGTKRVNGLLMAVPLTDGVNRIHMSYFPKTMKFGIIISLAGALAWAVIYLKGLRLKKKRIGIWGKKAGGFLEFEDKTAKGLCIVYIAAWLCVMLVMYVSTTAYGIYYYIQKFI